MRAMFCHAWLGYFMFLTVTYQPTPASCLATTQATYNVQGYNSYISNTTLQQTLVVRGLSATTVLVTAISDMTVTSQMCITGSFSATNSSQCTYCVPGKYSTTPNATDVSACQSCLAGTYSSTQGASTASACIQCSAGTYQANTGASSNSSCLACAANSSSYAGSKQSTDCVCSNGFSGPNGGPCKACNSSFWCFAGTANPCPLHSASSPMSWDLSQCLCMPGYYGDSGMGRNNTGLYPTLCQFCKENYYCPGNGTNQTQVCPGGQYSPAGSDDSGDCKCPDFATSVIKSTNISQCLCIPGYYKVLNKSDIYGGWRCKMCQPGQYCYNDLNTTCPAHTTSDIDSTRFLDCYCTAGYYNMTVQTADNMCQECPANSYCTGGGSIVSCTANAVSPTQSPDSRKCYCDWGYEGVNNSACMACVSPNYCYGGIKATCPFGSSCSNLSWSISNCTCNPGYWGASGGACRACGPGKYKPSQGCNACTNQTDADCVLCPSGTFSNAVGRTSVCDACPAGTYSAGTSTVCTGCGNGTFSLANSSTCTACQLGYYAQVNSSTCTPCPKNTYLNVNGKGSVLDCLPCPTGTTSSVLGNSDPGCSACPVGSYQAGDSCAACINGTFSRGSASSCSLCGAGFFSNSNASACLACQAGYFSAGNGSYSCSACQAGAFSLGQASACANCSIGTYGMANASSCTTCSAGYYAGAGSSQCLACSPGTWSASVIGYASDCSGCVAGTYSTSPGATTSGTCTACFAGGFSTVVGASNVSQNW